MRFPLFDFSFKVYGSAVEDISMGLFILTFDNDPVVRDFLDTVNRISFGINGT